MATGEPIPLNQNPTSTPNRIVALPAAQSDAKHCKGLWDKAYSRLKSEKKELIETYEGILAKNAAIPEDLSLKEKMTAVIDTELCIVTNRQWKIRIPWRQEPVVVRSLVDKIVKVVLKLKDVGSAAAAIDPIHVGLPFAGICVLLPVSDSASLLAISGLMNSTAHNKRLSTARNSFIGFREDHGSGRSLRRGRKRILETGREWLYEEIYSKAGKSLLRNPGLPSHSSVPLRPQYVPKNRQKHSEYR